MKRLLVIVVGSLFVVALLFGSLLIGSANKASAATVTHPAQHGSAIRQNRLLPQAAPILDFATLAKTCGSAAVLVLGGKIDSTTCVRQGPQNFYGRGKDCSGDWYGYQIETEIFNYNWTANLCFYGDQTKGYLGVAIYQINEIINYAANSGWFLWYPAHAYRVLSGNGGYYSWGNGYTGVEITQLCVGSTQGGHC